MQDRSDEGPSLTSELCAAITLEVARAGGWIGFDRFMQMALYQSGLGYYANHSRKFGAMPSSGSDFVTAPEMSPLFGRCLAAQVAQAMEQSGVREIWEFGAGSGALARQLLQCLGQRVQRYVIVEVSSALRQRQQAALAEHAPRVEWAERLPERIEAIVLGNEVLDAMPVTLLAPRGWTVARTRRGIGRKPGGLEAGGLEPDGLDPARPARGNPARCGAIRLVGSPHGAAPSRADRGRARLPDRNPSPGRGLHAHPGRRKWSSLWRSSIWRRI